MIHNKEAESETRFYGFIRAVSVGLTHIISIAFPVFIAFLSLPGTSVFSWHPFLMTVAFGFFMTEAILLFSPHGSFIKRFPHKTKGRVHWILQSLCGSCAVLGLAAVYYNKNLNVLGSHASHLPLSGQRLVPRQAEALPRRVRTRHLPAGLHQPAARALLLLVHGVSRGVRLVPGSNLPRSQRSDHYESGLQCLRC
ncbi:transmembrane reductase CYB561D2 isoform X2 [Xiphophorus couchianus]|uniref:transmembrane reductase CYB561D2 isoform X2 n=1 Tax=Xiphophorus couchianus TaxID=32473 RepID=UPI001015F9EC|nr:cytochrome b561 domain-containing protein 2 isoform X2 [Xiphophorus couchianus]